MRILTLLKFNYKGNQYRLELIERMMFGDRSWSPASVDAGSAERLGAVVLFNVGLFPSCEGCEITETRVVVIVSVPKRDIY